MNDQTADRCSLGMGPTSSPASPTPRFTASGLYLAHKPESRALMPSTQVSFVGFVSALDLADIVSMMQSSLFHIIVADPPVSPARNAEPVSNAWRYMHSYFRLRHSRSMNTLSIHRPRPSIEMRTPASRKTPVNRGEVNWLP